ncbi:MAG: integrase, partial [archaeon]
MVDVEDVNRFERLFKGQLEKLKRADIHESDRKAIIEFIQAQEAGGTIARSTLTGRINRLRLAAERADTPLVEMEHTDVNGLLFSLRHDHDLSEGTLRNYRKALRLFYRHRGVDWADDIEVGASPSASRTVDPSELLD